VPSACSFWFRICSSLKSKGTKIPSGWAGFASVVCWLGKACSPVKLVVFSFLPTSTKDQLFVFSLSFSSFPQKDGDPVCFHACTMPQDVFSGQANSQVDNTQYFRSIIQPNYHHCTTLVFLAFANNEPCAGGAPPRMKKGRMAAGRGDVKDRLDIRAASRTNNVIWMPRQHHRLSLPLSGST